MREIVETAKTLKVAAGTYKNRLPVLSILGGFRKTREWGTKQNNLSFFWKGAYFEASRAPALEGTFQMPLHLDN